MRGRSQRGARLALAIGTCLFPLWTACAGAPARPTAPARSADDPIVSQLTQLLKLDPAQQERVRQLLLEQYERDARIRAKWEQGARVRPEEILASRGIFERDLMALLSEEQRRTFADERLKLQMKGLRGSHGGF